MKKIIAVILALIMVFTLASCSKTNNAESDNVVQPVPKDGKAELTILTSNGEYDILTQTAYIKDYINKFERDFGVEVKLEKIGDNVNSAYTPEVQTEYIKKLSTKLYPKDGPELIFTRYMSMKALIKQGAVADLNSKVKNIDKIYDSLLSDRVYYAPLGIFYMSRRMNEYALQQLNIAKPGLDWTSNEYYDIRDKWVSQNNPLFNTYEYEEAVHKFIDLRSLYKAENNQMVLNTPGVRQKINEIRDYILNGKYQLANGYKYKNFYNMIFEKTSEESKLSSQSIDINDSNGHIDSGMPANLFRAENVKVSNTKYGTLVYPEFKDREVYIYSYGFLVNNNGKNLNLAYEFINGLLTDEIQMNMFTEENYFSVKSKIIDFYPVNKEIEAKILKLESQQFSPEVMQLKEYALKELKDGRCRIPITADEYDYRIFFEINKDLAKFILADTPYTDEQLQAELKKVEDKYNIYLNE